jgi:5-methylcytosine-specific restriction protein A
MSPMSPKRPCSHGCGQPVVRNGKCSRHLAQYERQRGSSAKRGYGQEHRDRFRAGVLQRDDYTCVLCGAEAKVADHYPRTRKQLIAAGDDPNAPEFGRALCGPCHSRHTDSTSIFGKHN